jgi:hypothetical protein
MKKNYLMKNKILRRVEFMKTSIKIFTYPALELLLSCGCPSVPARAGVALFVALFPTQQTSSSISLSTYGEGAVLWY